jgi:ComF family protein
LKQIFTNLADIIFPPKCIGCGVVFDGNNSHFCGHCFAKINFIKSPLCHCCGIPYLGDEESNHLCGNCISTKPHFISARAVGQFDGVLLDAIHQFKYRGNIAIGKALGELMAENEYPSLNIKEYSLIIPVPLHLKRLKERGFNQSAILAKTLAKKFRMPLDITSFKRCAYTEPQVRLKKQEREANVKGAFEVTDRRKIAGQKVILVDDVYTTGNTVKECARMLVKNKAEQVAVLTLARVI